MQIDSLFTLIRPEVPQCPDFVIEQHAVRAIRTLCERSRVWREWQGEYLDEGIEEYPLETDTGEIFAVENVQTDKGVRLRPLDYELPGQDNDNMHGISGVVGYTFKHPQTLWIQGTPTQNEDIFLEVILRPKMSDTEIPDWLAEQYEDAIVAGTLSRLMMVAAKPWFNAELSAYHKREFGRGISQARADAIRRHTNTRVTMNAQPF
jgi:hypothetical protein